MEPRPAALVRRPKLQNPVYTETAAYGHLGRRNEVVKKQFKINY